MHELRDKRLVVFSKVFELERNAVRLAGDRGKLLAQMAEDKARIAETELQILQIGSDLRIEVSKELREVAEKRGELTERRIAAEDQLKRVNITSPEAGVVHDLTVFTVGGVIKPGEQILVIVPTGAELVVEAKILAADVNSLQVGQKAFVRLSAFNRRTTPELTGFVSLVSADAVQDQRTGISYYTVRIKVPPDELSRLGDVKLVAGMPAEINVQLTPRSVLSYITRPLQDYAARAFRER
jgi:HlyD family secretion protein